ncbi:hypothetical protein CS0771_15230 [Catellatospora sp. IY07-71]|uniref:hypothetical protein n=1 Tax=Catellatospora sp. IY07-71 TaxID=2728827 RepID=UPI001BB34182|nr:hypothetical protein [Catellatospora sp. IY07-71]BCJ71979.1 hypothetical protein CS0771_15230 [Catellatospora sp. IY07-71]
MLQRGLLGLAVVAATAATGLPAHADTTPPTRFTFAGEGWSAVSGAQAYAYTSTTAGTAITVTSSESHVRVQTTGGNEMTPSGQVPGKDSWDLSVAVPPGKTLAVGTYTAKNELPRTGAYLSFWGNHRACATEYGSFTIHELELVGTTVTRINLTFEQNCQVTVPTRGRVLFGVPDLTALPRPIAEAAAVTVEQNVELIQWIPARSLSKVRVPRVKAVGRGTLTCPGGGYTMNIALIQPQEPAGVSSSVQLTGQCTGTPQPWSGTFNVEGTGTFEAGAARIHVRLIADAYTYYFFERAPQLVIAQPVVLGTPVRLNGEVAPSTGTSVTGGPLDAVRPSGVRQPSAPRSSPGRTRTA